MKGTSAFTFCCTATTAFAGRLPDLYPPGETIGPSLWEQYRWAIVGGAVFCAGFAAFLAWLWRRPRAIVCIPPEVAARQSLERLSHREEDGLLAGQVSRVLRDYLPGALHLEERELTVDELALLLPDEKFADITLKTAFLQLLRDCDIRKYGAASRESFNLVSRALKLVEDIEAGKQATAPSAGAAAKTT